MRERMLSIASGSISAYSGCQKFRVGDFRCSCNEYFLRLDDANDGSGRYNYAYFNILFLRKVLHTLRVWISFVIYSNVGQG